MTCKIGSFNHLDGLGRNAKLIELAARNSQENGEITTHFVNQFGDSVAAQNAGVLGLLGATGLEC